MDVLEPDALWDGECLRSGWGVGIEADRLAWVGPMARCPEEAKVQKLPYKLLLSGFVNAHSHAFQRGLRSHVQYATDTDSFWSWRDRMYRLANNLSPEGIEAVSSLAFLEMIRAGFTSVGEFHYLHHSPEGVPYSNPDELALRVVAGARRVGLRIVLLRVAYARAGFQKPPNPLQRRFIDSSPEDVLLAIERLQKLGIPVGLAPHSVRAVPKDWLQAFAGYQGVIHAHVAEQPLELEASQLEYNKPPLLVFQEAGLVHARFTAVHLTHPTPEEIRALSSVRGRICACPSTELDLGDGLLPIEKLEGIRLCIGTDSHAIIDPFVEIRSLEWHGRARTGSRNVMVPHNTMDALSQTLLFAGTRAGARSLSLPSGQLKTGMLADLITVSLDRPELEGCRCLPGVVFGGSGAWVEDVWVGGVQVLKGRQHHEERQIREQARAAIEAAFI